MLDAAELNLRRVVHEVIHNPAHGGVRVGKIVYPVKVADNGCRSVKIGGRTFMEQNKKKTSEYAIRAQNGEKLTWIIQPGDWELITDLT